MEAKISEILRTRLKGKNISKLAREIGVSKSLLSDWISSRRLPSLRNIESVAKVAAYLGLTLDQLLLGRETDRKNISTVSFEDDRRSYRIHIERLK
jgi:transcriptional regulator with XRE-family HTH domain